MSEPAENYITNDMHERFRAQAFTVWIAAFTISLVWVLLIVLPPILAANSFENIADAIYGFFSYICHQKLERSLHLFGHQFAVCSRCFGVYFGILLGIAAYPRWRRIDDIEPLPRFWLFLSLVPIGIDWSLSVFGIWENNHVSRLITGLILGFACATYIVPAAVEITRNFARKRSSR